MSKPCNGGQWTEARKRSFIISALRSATSRWGPKQEALKRARVIRGIYLCALCKKEGPATTWRTYKSGVNKGSPKKVKNTVVDHIVPVVDPLTGFVGWDTYIERMFCEADGLQVICHDCHEKVTAEERAIATERKRKENIK